jgi:hypothetical protein
LAIRGWLKSRELPLWSLKPPYFSEMTLVSPHDPPDSRSPEGRVKGEGANRGYEFSSEESEGEENNREVKDDPLDSSSPEGRVKGEGEKRLCILAITGCLKPRELPLWSLKPPYFPEMTLVSPLSETPTLGTPS